MGLFAPVRGFICISALHGFIGCPKSVRSFRNGTEAGGAFELGYIYIFAFFCKHVLQKLFEKHLSKATSLILVS
jgi:hypothetical protein